jgi:hypothetical protein
LIFVSELAKGGLYSLLEGNEVESGAGTAPPRRTSTPVGTRPNDIEAEAEDLGADAVVGASFDHEETAEGMLRVQSPRP